MSVMRVPSELYAPLSLDWRAPKTLIAITSGRCKFTDFIHSVHPNESPLKILQNRERGRIQGQLNFLGTPLLSQERVKLRTSNFVCIFTGSDYRNKSALKMLGKVAVGIVRDSRKFSGQLYIGRIGRSSLR